MQHSARKLNLLITDTGSFLGSYLAKKFLANNYIVYGLGTTHPKKDVLENPNFTFLDIDLSQPVPPHLPGFDLIVHLMAENQSEAEWKSPALSAATQSLITLSKLHKTKTFLLAKISAGQKITEIYSDNNASENLDLFLIGHVYGPGMNLHQEFTSVNSSYFENNSLINLISQAVENDKIILENEGLDMIYPVFIDDTTEAIYKYAANKFPKKIRFITSQHPLTAISVAYELQNSTRLNLHKELNLYFKGEEKKIEKYEPHPVVRVQDLGFSPKYSFGEGLEKTLLYFRSKDSAKTSNFQQNNDNPPIIPAGPKRRPQSNNQINIKEKKQKIKLTNLGAKLPSVNFKLKTVFIALILLTFVITARAVVNLYMGINNLKSSQHSLKVANLKDAKKSALQARSALKSASSSFLLLTKPVAFSKKIQAFNMGMESTLVGSSSLVNFIDGAEKLAQNLATITSQDTTKTTLNLEEPTAALTKAFYESERAYTLALEGAKNSLFFKSKFKIAQENFNTLSSLSLTAKELTSLIADFAGKSAKKNYLVLLVNNTELRPGGGFIGNFGEVSFEDSKLKEIKVEDIYTIDGQLKEKIAPPAVLTQKLGVKELYLRDSNWTVDFAINAKTARDFYKKETGKTVDGVISIDLTFLEKLLEKLGPIKLEDYNEEITAQNLFDKGEYYSEVGFFPGSTQKRDFFASLTSKIIAKIIEGTSTGVEAGNNPAYIALFEVAAEGLAQKHIMFSFDDSILGSFIKMKGWDNPLPPTMFNPSDNSQATRDFLAISEANIGANKVNRYLKRKVDYDMTIGRDADLMGTLTITYINDSPADTWPGGTYVNYLRIMIPKNSSLEKYLEDGKEVDLEKLVGRAIIPAVETTIVGELTQFAKLVEIPVKTTKTFTFKYRIPKNIKLEKAPTYELYILKQPGTDKDPMMFTFNLPAYLKIDSVSPCHSDSTPSHSERSEESNCLGSNVKGKQNYTTETDLSTDRNWEIRVSKR